MPKEGLDITVQKVLRLILRSMNSRVAFIFWAILFKISLEASYWFFVSPVYGYMGFAWMPDALKYFESWVLYLVLIVSSPKKLDRASDLFLAIILFNIITPVLGLYSLADKNRSYVYILLFGFLLIFLFRRGRLIRLPTLKKGHVIAKGIIISFVIGISAWFLVSGGVRFFNLDLVKVYEYRRMAEEVIRAGPMGYLNTWAFFVFGPALLTLALWKRTFFWAGIILLIHVFWFGVSTHKFVLFAPSLAIFIWFWLRKTSSMSWIPLGLFFVITISTALFSAFDMVRPASMFVRRVFYVPSLLTFEYYDFFASHQWVFWSNSKATLGLLNYPYDLNTAALIGRWTGLGAHANNGFLASGYMHAGVWGVAIYGMTVGFLFRIIDSIARKRIPTWAALGVIIIPVYSLIISSDLPTALLTKGLGVGCLILFLLRSACISVDPQGTKFFQNRG